jgi:predicted DCC family thiol-disulfide oxidoreductase YuxK
MSVPRTYFNGDCPVCAAGIRRMRRATDGLDWIDIAATPDAVRACGATREAVKKRLHVIDRDGVLRIGVPAFAALWDEVPRYRPLAYLVRLPLLRAIASGLYEIAAALLYAWNRRRERRRAA